MKHPKWILIVDAAAIFAFFALVIWAFIRLLYVIPYVFVSDQPLDWIAVLSAIIIGYLLADFTSGFVHFLGDTFGSRSTPIFGPFFVEPFREHHVDEKDITRHGFIETNGHNCFASLPVLLALVFLVPESALQNGWGAWFFLTALVFILGIFATNQFHKWAHLDKAPASIAWLQKHHFILSPTHHQLHHTAPYTSDFCITTGWLNPLLNKIHFFPQTKRLLSPIMPKSDEI